MTRREGRVVPQNDPVCDIVEGKASDYIMSTKLESVEPVHK